MGNPEVGKAPNRYDRAHEKGSGFGFITFDPVRKTYALDSYRFLIDATDGTLARVGGVSTRTVRYYIAQGLLPGANDPGPAAWCDDPLTATGIREHSCTTG